MIKRSLDKSIGFLVTDVSRLLRTDFDRRVRALGMTQVQWRAIAHIARDEGLNQSALAERLEVKPITIARLIDRMEKTGWVRRRPDEADRRATLLFLTAKAKPVLEKLQEHADEAMQAVLQGIGAEGEEALIAGLERMKLNLAAPHEGPAASGGVDHDHGRRERKAG